MSGKHKHFGSVLSVCRLEVSVWRQEVCRRRQEVSVCRQEVSVCRPRFQPSRKLSKRSEFQYVRTSEFGILSDMLRQSILSSIWVIAQKFFVAEAANGSYM